MRQIVLDTETTGIGAETGHRIIEIGCVELVNRKLTGEHFHIYLNPQREVDQGAFAVHGISTTFLKDKPLFRDVVSSFLAFIENAELIIHNAPFDVGFLNAELKRIRWPKPLQAYCTIFDTLAFARDKHPGQRNSLDALCKRYSVDNSNRKWHGALLDAEILAFVYLAMTGGQATLFSEEETTSFPELAPPETGQPLSNQNAVVYFADEDEQAKHQEFVEMLIKKSGINHWQKNEEQ